MTDLTATRRTQSRIFYLVLFTAFFLLGVLLSLGLGSNLLSPIEVVNALQKNTPSVAHNILWEQRIPRTFLAIACGMALAVAGSLMQSLTRNPLAEPGLLGINAGASVFVVLSVVLFGVLDIFGYMVAAFIGSAVTGVGVYILGRGRSGSIVKLALAGVAISAALSAVNQALILANQDAYDEFRFWVAGSLEGRGTDIFFAILPTTAVGLLVALWVTPAINALSMGEDAAVSLGVNVKLTQFITLVAVTILAGSATAAIGPISFVGLAVPFIVRNSMGNDVRWVTLGSAILGPVWLLLTDVVARLIIIPEETQVGIIATLLGAPLFIVLMSRQKVEAL